MANTCSRLGGLGRGLASHLADQEAIYLAFFSRTADFQFAAQKVLHQLQERILESKIYTCGITDKEILEMVFARISNEKASLMTIFLAAVASPNTVEMMPAGIN